MVDDKEEPLRLLHRSYFAMLPLRLMGPILRNALAHFTEEDFLKETADYECFNGFSVQESILRDCISYQRLQPSTEYRKKFLKLLVEEIEARKWEVHEDVWTAGSQFFKVDCGTPIEKLSEHSADGYRTFFLDRANSSTVSIVYQPSLISSGTTGLTTWDAAFYMVEWLSAQPDFLRDKRVIELGAGSGLAGMCISKLFTPSEYVFTDHHEDVLQKLQDNLKLNKLEKNPSLKLAKLDWTDVTERDLALWSPDVALASDVVYDPELFQPFFTTLNLLSECNRSRILRVLIAVKIRAEETFQKFETAAGSFGWNLRNVSSTSAIGRIFPTGSYSPDSCHVYQVCRSTSF